MIKSITVTNYLGDSILLELGRPEQSGFLIRGITGLGPVKATVNIKDNATGNGGDFNSARQSSRNIVMDVLYQFAPTIEAARHLSYKYFPVKKQVLLVIETDTRNCYISGIVESNEPDIFSQQSGTQISIICPDPSFYSIDTQTTVFSGIQPSFELPFEDPLSESPSLEFGYLLNSSEKNIIYDGDSEVGVTISIHANGSATDLTICNTGTREIMSIDTDKLAGILGDESTSLIDGDDVTITTEQGFKSITLLRAGQLYNIRNALNIDADWFKLVKGDNVFAFLADTGLTNLQFKIENKIAYEGV